MQIRDSQPDLRDGRHENDRNADQDRRLQPRKATYLVVLRTPRGFATGWMIGTDDAEGHWRAT